MTDDTTRTPDSVEPPTAAERTRYSWTETGTPSVGVVEAVAAATDRDATELPQLADAIDPDALNDLVANAEATDEDVHVSFAYASVHVTVSSAGAVSVADE